MNGTDRVPIPKGLLDLSAGAPRLDLTDQRYLDIPGAYFPWSTGDFSLTATVTPKASGRIAPEGVGSGTLFAKVSNPLGPYEGPAVFLYDDGSIRFRLAKTYECGEDNFAAVPGGWRADVPVRLLFVRASRVLWTFADGAQIARKALTRPCDVSGAWDAPLRIGGHHIHPTTESLSCFVHDLGSFDYAVGVRGRGTPEGRGGSGTRIQPWGPTETNVHGDGTFSISKVGG